MPRPPRKPADDATEPDDEQMLEYVAGPTIFLHLRQQNIELLKLAIDLAERINPRGEKSSDPRVALEQLWSLYAELYDWIDPEQAEDEDE
ncbi:MAG: hypothetical protein KatS3mg108_1687 [Isosphaeraceae bacterium]|jgi:hypothetical protein|nr:MAG: hypothetical protein KatS3mg108_1687 [Isosphaeraceae bacterium]